MSTPAQGAEPLVAALIRFGLASLMDRSLPTVRELMDADPLVLEVAVGAGGILVDPPAGCGFPQAGLIPSVCAQ